MLFNKPWNGSSLNQCLPWRAQLSQVGWLGRSSDMPCSPGCWNPPFHQSQASPSPWKCGFEVTRASHGAKQGFMELHRFMCPPKLSSWARDAPEKPAGPPLPGAGTHWDGQRERLAWSGTALVTFGAVLNSPWGSLYFKQSCDFLLVSLSSHRARHGSCSEPASSYKGKRDPSHLFWWVFFKCPNPLKLFHLESELGPRAMRGNVTRPK